MRPTTTLAFPAILALTFGGLLGCGKSDESAARMASNIAPAATATAPMDAVRLASTLETQQPQPRKIIYTGEVTLDCENLEKTTEKLLSAVRQMGGYVGDATSNGTKGTVRESSWTVRIPAGRYDDLMATISGLGELESSSRKAQDVSEEFYDAQARLKNKNVEEERLIELLKNRSARLTDVLTVEKELSRVREEIERIEGRLRFLANQSDLSTVTVTFREVKDFVPVGTPGLGTRTGRAFHDSVGAMKDLGESVVIFGVTVAPWVLPILVIVFLARKLSKRRTKTVSVMPPADWPDIS